MNITDNKTPLIYLTLVISISLLLGLFLDWEITPYLPIIIIAFGVVFIKFISLEFKTSSNNQKWVFILLSIINFLAYTIPAFAFYSGGAKGIMGAIPILIVLGIIYVQLKERISKKGLHVVLDILILVSFVFATLLIYIITGLAGMGV